MTFVDHYLHPEYSVQVLPGEDGWFSVANVVAILNSSRHFFGEPTLLAGKIRHRLDGGIVLAKTDAKDPNVVKGGHTFYELRERANLEESDAQM